MNISSLLEVAESFNSNVPGFNSSVTRPTATTTVITAAAGVMNSGEAFILLVFAMILSMFGWVAFWICPRRWFIVPLGFLGTAMAFGTAAAALIHTSAQLEKDRIDAIDPMYAQEAKVGTPFMGLLWSAVVALVLSFAAAGFGLWAGMGDGDDYGWRSVTMHGEEEEEILKAKIQRPWLSFLFKRGTWRRGRIEMVR